MDKRNDDDAGGRIEVQVQRGGEYSLGDVTTVEQGGSPELMGESRYLVKDKIKPLHIKSKGQGLNPDTPFGSRSSLEKTQP